MPTAHETYTGFLIYDGAAGEKAHAGAFYRPKKGDNLSHITVAAWGGGMNNLWRVINANPWNRANCIYIKGSDASASSNCSLKRVPLDDLVSPGYLSLCPEVSLGKKYQMIWIPPMTAPLSVPEVPAAEVDPLLQMYLKSSLSKPMKVNASNIHRVTAEELAKMREKKAAAEAAAEMERNSYTYRGADNGANASTDSAGSSSYLPWIIGGIVIAAGAIFYATTRTDGRKRRR
jgi:hypothetical protein